MTHGESKSETKKGTRNYFRPRSFGPERPGLWPDPPGLNRPVSKLGQIKNDRLVRNSPEYKPVNPGLFSPLLARNGDGTSKVGNPSWRRVLAPLRAEASDSKRRHGASAERDGAAQGEGDDDRFPSKVLALHHLLTGKTPPSSSSP
jgi:hypothetical protein